MKTKIIAGISGAVAAALAVYSYMTLPDTVAVQIGVDGQVSNTMPKLFAVALPIMQTAAERTRSNGTFGTGATESTTVP